MTTRTIIILAVMGVELAVAIPVAAWLSRAADRQAARDREDSE